MDLVIDEGEVLAHLDQLPFQILIRGFRQRQQRPFSSLSKRSALE